MVTSSGDSLYSRIYDLVKQVPEGRVTTYGDLARVAGTTARVVGFALAALPPGHDVPWQRVINSQGEVSRRKDGDRDHLQALLLEGEGLRFNQYNRIDLKRFRWHFHQ